MLYCDSDCDSDKMACLRCPAPGSRQSNHRIVSLEEAYSTATSAHTMLLEGIEGSNATASESACEMACLEDRVGFEVMQWPLKANDTEEIICNLNPDNLDTDKTYEG